MLDLTGKRFGQLTAIRPTEKQDRFKRYIWLFRCECGNQVDVSGFNAKSGHTKSCGCLRISVPKIHNRIHGCAPITGCTVEYNAWCSMKRRCYGANTKDFPRYGARGIRVCNRWLHSFPNFLADMGLKPTPKHSLDRWPDPDGNYEPGYCRWATMLQQRHNRGSRASFLRPADCAPCTRRKGSDNL